MIIPGNPCLLAVATAENDYAFGSADTSDGNLVVRRNNLAQRNLSLIDVLGSAAVAFPFLAGHLLNADRFLELAIDRRGLPQGATVLLSLDDDGRAFPQVDLTPAVLGERVPVGATCGSGLVFLERTRVETTFGCCRGVLTLEKGSRFDCLPPTRLDPVHVKGGEVVVRDGRRLVEIRENTAVVRLAKEPNRLYPLSLELRLPANVEGGREYTLTVAQRDEQGTVVGGATAIFRLR